MTSLPEFDALYELEEIIGSGLTCVVYKCRELATGEAYAVKVIDLRMIMGQPDEEERIARIKREVQILNQVEHPNIIRLHRVYSAPRSKLYLVMELCSGGELCDLLLGYDGHLPEQLTRAVLLQVVAAVEYLHQRGIAHRDLKMENILLKQPSPDSAPLVKLVDFGFARQLLPPPSSATPSATARGGAGGRSPLLAQTPHHLNLSFVGTIAYAAPEMIHHKSYDCRCDLYSVGVLMYVCLAGSLPFRLAHASSQEPGYVATTTTLDLREALSFGDPAWLDISPEAQDLVRHLLVDEYERFSAAQFLAHPWCHAPPASRNQGPIRPPQTRHKHKLSLQAPVNELIDFKRGADGETVEQIGSQLRSSGRRKPAPKIVIDDLSSGSDSASDSESSSSLSSQSSPSSSPFISPNHSPGHSPRNSPPQPSPASSSSSASSSASRLTVPGRIQRKLRKSTVDDRSSD